MSDQANDGRPKKLGRGLSSLLAVSQAPVSIKQSPIVESKPQQQQSSGGVQHIDLSKIHTSPYQPRVVMDPAAIERLAESIRHAGVMQPVVVRPRGEQYELVVGERRWRAARLAGLTSIPAVVRELSDVDAAEWALVENVQREDLNAIERAQALKNLAEKFQLSTQDLAARIALDRTTVINLIRLTDLEPEISDLIQRGELSGGHGKALLTMPGGERRISLAKDAAKMGWSVRRLEAEARDEAIASEAKQNPSQTTEPAARLAVLRDLERQVSQQLGTKVTITADRKGKRGKIMIDYYGLDHFDGLLARMGVKANISL